MATLTGYKVGSGSRSIRLRTPIFQINNLTEGYINYLKFNIPLHISSSSNNLGPYNLRLVIFQQKPSDSGWYEYSNDGTYWYYGTDTGSSSDYIYESNYASIIGADNIINDSFSTSVTFSGTGSNNYQNVSFTLTNLKIPVDTFLDNNRIAIAIIGENNGSLNFTSVKSSGEIGVISNPVGSFTTTNLVVVNESNQVISTNYPVVNKHKLKASWSYSGSAEKYTIALIKKGDEVAEVLSTTSNSCLFNVPEPGEYHIGITPYNGDLFGEAIEFGEPKQFYSIQIENNLNYPLQYKDALENIIENSTTSSVVYVTWNKASYCVKAYDGVSEEGIDVSEIYPFTTAYFNTSTISATASTNYSTGKSGQIPTSTGTTLSINKIYLTVDDPYSTIDVFKDKEIEINKNITITSSALADFTYSNTIATNNEVVYSIFTITLNNAPSSANRVYYRINNNGVYQGLDLVISGTSKLATFRYYNAGVRVSSINFYFDNNASFSFNGTITQNATYNFNPAFTYLTSWNFNSASFSGIEKGYLYDNLNFNLGDYVTSNYIPNLHNLKIVLRQKNQTVSWIDTNTISPNYSITLKRSSELLSSFNLEENITATYTIIDNQNLYSVVGNTGSITFKITSACSFNSLIIDKTEMEKYDLSKWMSKGNAVFQSATLITDITIPQGLSGGIITTQIGYDTENAFISSGDKVIVLTATETTPVKINTITVTVTYTRNEIVLLNESRSVTLNVKDSRVPYLPNSLALNFESVLNKIEDGETYFLPNYSKMFLTNLDEIKFPSNTGKISFYLETKDTNNFYSIPMSTVQEMNQLLEQILYDNNKTDSRLFFENKESSSLSIYLTAVDSKFPNKTISKHIDSNVHPAFIQIPTIDFVRHGTSVEQTAQVTFSYGLMAGKLKDDLVYTATTILTDIIDLTGNSDTKEVILEYQAKTEENRTPVVSIFSKHLPKNGNISVQIFVKYEGHILFSSIIMYDSFSEEVGEIAIRRHRVGFHGEPPPDHSLAIYAVSDEIGAYLLSFFKSGQQLGGFQLSENKKDIIFRAGEWK